MKTIKIFMMVSAAALLFSCNSNSSNKKTSDSKTNESAMMVKDNSNVNNTNNANSGKDDDFVKEAASGGMMEVELGKYAQQNALNPRVKNFGAMMVKDHSKANEELRTLATGKNIALPITMEDKQNSMISDLQKKTGKDFDKDYIDNMVNDHQNDIDEFRKQADNGKDAELKNFATKTLPILQTHLDSAKNIRESLK